MRTRDVLDQELSNSLRAVFMKSEIKQKGFTLVEVMIVVAIIGILSAIAVPSISTWLPNIRLKAAARDVFSDMMRAKMEAIKTNTTTSLTFTSGTGTPCVGGAYKFTNSTGTIIDISMAKDVCLSTSSDFPVGFSSRGTASGATGSIMLTHPQSSKTYKITQTIAGGIKIQ